MDRILLSLSLVVLTVSLEIDRSRISPDIDVNYLHKLRREGRHEEFAYHMGILDPSKVIPSEDKPGEEPSYRGLCTVSYNPEEARQATKFSRYPNRRWPKPPGKNHSVIPYNIDASIKTSDYMRIINTLKNGWNARVPWVQWVQQTDERDYVYIAHGGECYGELGRRGHKQTLMLDNACISSEIGILHEAMHSAGMDHEHSRMDRDNYIRILWENIDKNWSWTYNKHDPADYDDIGNYDYHTFMHYYKTAFTYGDKYAFVVLDKNVDIMDVANSKELTKEDINKLKIMYDV